MPDRDPHPAADAVRVDPDGEITFGRVGGGKTSAHEAIAAELGWSPDRISIRPSADGHTIRLLDRADDAGDRSRLLDVDWPTPPRQENQMKNRLERIFVRLVPDPASTALVALFAVTVAAVTRGATWAALVCGVTALYCAVYDVVANVYRKRRALRVASARLAAKERAR